jgi:3-hydroxymyristoyl/3-hydroxydecanoyl-(acyl carrier protein) dehydratase
VKHRHTLDVALDHPAFAGHFPGMPILPGALLLDEALCVIEQDRNLDLTRWQVTAAKFLEAVRPGDSLAIEHSTASDGTLRFAVRIAERTALSGILSPVAGAGRAPDSNDA